MATETGPVLLEAVQHGINKNGKIIWGFYSGKSTHQKPTQNLVTGSIFLEVDTWNVYAFDAETTTWKKAGGQ